VVPRTVYRLEFTEPEYEGMIVRVRKMSMAEAIRASFDLAWQPADDMAARRAKQHETFEMFIDHVLDWNLTEEDGTAVPQTVEGLLSLEPEFIGLLVGVWQAGRRAIAAPLEQNSSGGELSPVESTLTEIPFENLAS
jgi:uncharacterized protein YggL (DUF469 family)